MRAEGSDSAPFSLFKRASKRKFRNLRFLSGQQRDQESAADPGSLERLDLRGGAVGKQYSQHFSIQDGRFYCLLAVLFVRSISRLSFAGQFARRVWQLRQLILWAWEVWPCECQSRPTAPASDPPGASRR